MSFIPMLDIGLEKNRSELGTIASHFECCDEQVDYVQFENAKVYMRRGTSDIKSFIQVMVNQEYATCFKGATPKTILDLGAYIGLSALYFKTRSPDARIVCVEPSPSNFEILEMNVRGLGIETVNAAVWPTRSRLKIAEEFDGYWGTRLAEDANGDIQGVPLSEFLSSPVDLMKFDVEMTEKRLFSENTEWLGNVAVAAGELHERYLPGCIGAFDNLFRGYAISKEGETHMAVRQ